HTLVMTFRGADPDRPPIYMGAPTNPRGWIRHGENNYKMTFRIFRVGENFTTVFRVGAGGSNKEFALNMKQWGADHGAPFVPDHGSGTAIPTEQRLLIDAVEHDLLELDEDFIRAETVQLVQVVNAVNVVHDPDTVLAKIYVIHTINSE